MPLEPGEVLSRKYEIREFLGKGTITEVYLAHQKDLDRDVVIKVLNPHIAMDRPLFKRFVAEIEAVARLEVHPNVGWILDLDKDGRWVFYVNDYYIYSLKQMIKETQRLTPEDALRVCTQVLQALDYAHGHGILHRDIKPQNIMFKEDGTAVLTDFGIGEVAREAVQKLKLTQMLPTPVYMAPEHIRNPKTIDARADIYSVGAVLYEMLTGKPPFKGDIRTVYSMKFIGKYTPVKELAPEAPDELVHAVEKAMHKDPNARYGSAAEFLSEFEETSEEVFFIAKESVVDIDLPGVKKARMGAEVEVRDDVLLEIESLRFPLVVYPGEVFPVQITLKGHGDFQGLLKSRSQSFAVLDGPFWDISLSQEKPGNLMWQVKAPDTGTSGEFEINIYRGGQSVLRKPLVFTVFAATYPRLGK